MRVRNVKKLLKVVSPAIRSGLFAFSRINTVNDAIANTRLTVATKQNYESLENSLISMEDKYGLSGNGPLRKIRTLELIMESKGQKVNRTPIFGGLAAMCHHIKNHVLGIKSEEVVPTSRFF